MLPWIQCNALNAKKKVSSLDLASIYLPIASLSEHHHIADFLETIDYLIESKAHQRTKEILTNRLMLGITAGIKKKKN